MACGPLSNVRPSGFERDSAEGDAADPVVLRRRAHDPSQLLGDLVDLVAIERTTSSMPCKAWHV